MPARSAAFSRGRTTRSISSACLPETGRTKPSAYYGRVVDVMEELVKFTLLTRGASAYLTSRYSKRKEQLEKKLASAKLDAI